MALLTRVLHGIEAGIVGGVAMLGLFAAASMARGRVWWEFPNILGATFYNNRLYSRAGMVTMAGGALFLMMTGFVGAVFGLACGNVRSRHRLILLGTLAGVGWFYFANALVWPRINPLIPLYWPEPAAVLSHVLFGACLGSGALTGGISSAANGPSDAVDL